MEKETKEKPMTEEKEKKPCHSPLPWRVAGIADIEDANGTPCACGWNPDSDYGQEGQERAKADAEFIVDAVNHYKDLLADNIALHNRVDSMAADFMEFLEREGKLRDLLRRMLAVVERVKEEKVYALGTISDERIREMLEHRNVQRQKWGEELAELNSILEHARNVFGGEAGNGE